MRDWKPHAKPLTQEDQKGLSVEEILVLACADGRTSVSEIPYTTGMPPEVVREIVDRLESRGTLLRDPPDPRPVEPPAPTAPPRPATRPLDPPADDERDVGHEDAPPLPEGDEAPAVEVPDPGAVAEDATLEEQSTTFRQLYETRLAHLTRDERLARVGGASDPELSAFCFDPEPVVIHRIFENARTGLAHARLVAAHHRTSTGLEVLTKHQSMLRDGQVQRLLLRNGMLPQSLFTRILQPKRLSEVYRTMLSRDVPERTRTWTRNMLRQKWPVAPSEERVELVLQTEGRVLPILIGCNLDAKSTAILCKRSIVSVIFVRNFATWPSTPPPLIAHLLKQPLVKRMPQLRNMLLRHPNVSSEAKRKG